MEAQKSKDLLIQFSTFDEGSIAVALLQVFQSDNEKVKNFHDILKPVRKLCNAKNRTPSKNTARISKADIFEHEVNLMTRSLLKYHDAGNPAQQELMQGLDAIEFGLKLDANTNYPSLSKKFLVALQSTKDISNFLYCEAGRFYYHFKQNVGKEEFCDYLQKEGLSISTIKRWITWYKHCLHYPGFLVCGLTYSTILTKMKEIIDYIERKSPNCAKLRALLAMDLKQTTCQGKIMNFDVSLHMLF